MLHNINTQIHLQLLQSVNDQKPPKPFILSLKNTRHVYIAGNFPPNVSTKRSSVPGGNTVQILTIRVVGSGLSRLNNQLSLSWKLHFVLFFNLDVGSCSRNTSCSSKRFLVPAEDSCAGNTNLDPSVRRSRDLPHISVCLI